MVVQVFTALLALCGLAYYCAALLAARKYSRERTKRRAAQDALALQAAEFAPAVSILKPLRGVDAGMYDALASHCAQHYPGEYELIFGAQPDDAGARAAVERLQQEFPGRKISFVACAESLGPNAKVSTLAQMLPHAKHDHLLINDSDIFAPADYLRRVMQEFSGPQVGMVTAIYSGHCVADARGHIPLWSKLEALTVSSEFVPGCLLAMQMDGGVKFALGGTLAIRREVLRQIGGFETLLDVLADDYEMGVRTIAAGYRVAMAPVTVQTGVPPYTLKKFVAHQLRWLRTVRDARGLGYAGLPFTFGLMWAGAAVVASAGALWSWPLLSLALLARLALALSVGVGVLGDTQVLRDWWLIPLRDCVGAVLWAWSYASDEVEWRGVKFQLQKGKLTRIF
jgi:ceramide glucosyltransferase